MSAPLLASPLDGLGVCERAAILGLEGREFISLASEDPRLFAAPTLWGGGLTRVKAWLTAGRPPAKRGELRYLGDTKIGESVRTVLARLPEPVAHFVAGCVVVAGVGVETHGWRDGLGALPENVRQMVALATCNESVIGHELGHAWQAHERSAPRTRYDDDTRACFEALEEGRDLLALDAVRAGQVDARVRYLLEAERAADEASSVWLGVPFCTVDESRRQATRREIVVRARRAEAAILGETK
jgi:hypothetical protein